MEKIEKFSCDIWMTILDNFDQMKAGQTLFSISNVMFETIIGRSRTRSWGSTTWKK